MWAPGERARSAAVGGPADDEGHRQIADDETEARREDVSPAAAIGEERQARQALGDIERHRGDADAPAESGGEEGDGKGRQVDHHRRQRDLDLGRRGEQQRAEHDEGEIGGDPGRAFPGKKRPEDGIRSGHRRSHCCTFMPVRIPADFIELSPH